MVSVINSLAKIKKQEGDTSTSAPAPKFNQPELVLSSKSFFPSLEFATILNCNSFHMQNQSKFCNNYLASIFHPPSNCNTI
jgi:hypothetical protein